MSNTTAFHLRRSTDGRIVGQLVDGVWTKVVKTSRHRYWKLDAWCVDAQVYRSSRHLFHTLRVEDVEEGKVYVVSASIMDKEAYTISHPGHGRQLALPRKQWRIETPDDHQGPIPSLPEPETSYQLQLTL